ncbi:AMP-binding protein [Cryptosporangium minutisporangium]|uniref:Acyl-CoA synthetase n=1 Tax=Cryptosporangium minutisporangium TaxID=113569 RepID=A0ABP6T0F1_9ACTN
MSTPDQAPPGAYVLAADDPQRLALVGPDGREVTFGELGEAANRLADAFRARGLGAGDVVATMLHNSVEHFEAVLATTQIGLFQVPINVHLTPEEAAYIVTDSGAKALIAHDDLALGLAPVADQLPVARFAVGTPVAGWADYDVWKAEGSANPPDDRVAGAYLGYTSGTTGRPKGVRREIPPIPPELMITFFGSLLSGFALYPGPGVHLACSPLYHAAPGNIAAQSLHLGHTVVILPKFEPETVLRTIERYRVTSSQLVPTHVHRLLRLPADVRGRYDLSSLTNLLVAGAPFGPETKQAALDWLGPVVWEYLASTEGMVAIASPADARSHPGTVGRPTSEVRILDDDGEPVPVGEAGRIFFASPSAFVYHNDPEKTAAAVRPDGFVTAGDLGQLDEDGYLYLLDRRDDLIISGGVNVYPSEVEQRLLLHPAVADVAVIGAPDPEWGQTVVAIVQTEPGTTPGEALVGELDRHCRQGLAAQKCPRRFEFREALPRTPTGKLLRRTLREEVSAA